jgi:hypothetical protein
MSRNYYPSWLENIDFPATGVGDLTDLKHEIVLGEAGRWTNLVFPGWFYHNKKEQYHYISKGRLTAVTNLTSGFVVNSNSYRPMWGPVLLTSVSSGIQYVQHHNCFEPALTFSWSTTTSGQYYTTIPSYYTLLGIRDLTNQSLGSVASRNDVTSEKYYYHDKVNNIVYIKTPRSVSDVPLYLDCLSLNPSIQFKEIVVPRNNKVRLSYREAYHVVLSHGASSTTFTGPVTGEFLHNIPGVSNGDWVKATYFIPNSFCLVDHATLSYYVRPSINDTITIDFETSLPRKLNVSRINTAPVTGILNLNPLLPNSFRTGYLFHSTVSSSYSQIWSPSSKYTEFVSDDSEYCPSWGDKIKTTIFVKDSNNLPIPYYPITLSFGNAGTYIVASAPGSTYVDGRGECHLILGNSTLGNINATATINGISYTLTVTAYTPANWIPRNRFVGGRANYVVTNEINSYNRLKSYASACHLDGMPKIGANIVLKAKNSSVFEISNQTTGNIDLNIGQATFYAGMTPNNLASISSVIGFGPERGDSVYSSTANVGMSNLIEVLDVE